MDGGDFASDFNEPGRIKTKAYVAALKQLGYDVVGVGDRELAGGLDAFDEIIGGSGLPLTSATYTERGGTAPFLEPYLVREYDTAAGGKIRIGYLSLTTYNSLFARTGSPGRAVVHREPVDQARRYLPEIAKRSDIVVLLANLSPTDLQAAVEAAPGAATFALGAFGDRLSPRALETIGGVKTFYAGDQGKRIAEVRVFLDGGKVKEITAHDVYLTRFYPEAPEIQKLVAETIAGVNKAMKAVSGPQSPPAAGGVPVGPQAAAQAAPKYLTADACLKCHELAHRVWATSRHAHAIETLIKANQEFNSECLKCHTTGFGAPEGFQSAKTTPTLLNVQCESCHGAAALHVLDPAKTYGRVAPRVCSTCHTKENSPEFSFFKYWDKIKH